MAVFAGGATLEAAEEVADADLDTLGSLVEKSLVRHTDGRYWMYETIREFAIERLETSEEAQGIRRRFANYWLTLAGTAEPHLRAEDDEWLDRLGAEQDNVRAALDDFDARGEHELELQLCAAFWWVWSLRGSLREGRRRLEHVLAADPRPTSARANALIGAFDISGDQGDYAFSRAFGEEALAIHRELGNAWHVAYVLMGLGLLLNLEDRFAEAVPLLEESVQRFRDLGDEHWEMQTSRRLAWAYESLGDLPRARSIHEENLLRARASGDAFVEARSLDVLAQFHLDAGHVEPAIPMLMEAHRIKSGRQGTIYRYQGTVLACRVAFALALVGEGAAAIRVLSCADASFEELEFGEGNLEAWIVGMNARTQELVRHIDEATAAAATDEGRKLTIDEAVAQAFELLGAT
jgi:tetratricopeptide (TPR) repeat protein